MRTFVLFLCLAFPAAADPSRPFCTSGSSGAQSCIRTAHVAFDTCQMIGTLARQTGIDVDFFARLIWQESRFDFNALSPAGAQGIAQFMPGTAKLRQLPDSYNPALALEASAIYLAELTRRYGNPGLAAVAYNGGEARANGFTSKTGGLATETINYVRIITGLEAEDWRDAPPKDYDLSLVPGRAFLPACLTLAATRRITPFKEPKSNAAPWGVQLASGDSRATALKRYKLRARSCRSAIGGRKPQIIRKKPQVTGRKAYYVARLGQQTRAAANRLCAKIRHQTCACAVYKN
ncbi:MAG: lytic transglycosylase domain-containing protein [Pseudomonadota bacterium]